PTSLRARPACPTRRSSDLGYRRRNVLSVLYAHVRMFYHFRWTCRDLHDFFLYGLPGTSIHEVSFLEHLLYTLMFVYNSFTATIWDTLLIIPRTAGLSSRTTESLTLLSPNVRTTLIWLSFLPITLRLRVISNCLVIVFPSLS